MDGLLHYKPKRQFLRFRYFGTICYKKRRINIKIKVFQRLRDQKAKFI